MLLNESIKDYQENKKSISVSIWVHRGVEQIALNRQSRLVTPFLLDLNTQAADSTWMLGTECWIRYRENKDDTAVSLEQR